MKRKLFMLAVVALLVPGCYLVPTDGWPKATLYWSQAAKDYRARQHLERAPGADVPPNPCPENPAVNMFGNSDLSRDVVTTNATCCGQVAPWNMEVTRIHQGWIYRIYTNGGIDSITSAAVSPKK